MAIECLQVHLPDKANNTSLELFQVEETAQWGRKDPVVPIPNLCS